jgi:hypothetical protein
MMGSELLKKEWRVLVDKIEGNTLNADGQEKAFRDFAQAFLKKIVFKCKSETYRPIDIEIYYHSEHHSDPYVHKNEKQLNYGAFYFHASGVDVVFGDKDEKIYFGVLICGIEDIEDTSNVLNKKLDIKTKITEIISCDNTGSNAQFPCNKIGDNTDANQIYRSTRANLHYSPLDSHNRPFIARRYRFASKMPSQGKERFSNYYWLDCLNSGHEDCLDNNLIKTHKFFQEYCKRYSCTDEQKKKLKKWGINL